jgi:hypothetical protein
MKFFILFFSFLSLSSLFKASETVAGDVYVDLVAYDVSNGTLRIFVDEFSSSGLGRRSFSYNPSNPPTLNSFYSRYLSSKPNGISLTDLLSAKGRSHGPEVYFIPVPNLEKISPELKESLRFDNIKERNMDIDYFELEKGWVDSYEKKLKDVWHKAYPSSSFFSSPLRIGATITTGLLIITTIGYFVIRHLYKKHHKKIHSKPIKVKNNSIKRTENQLNIRENKSNNINY